VPATRVAPAVEPPTLPRGPGGAEGPSAPPPSAPARKRTGLMVGISAVALLVAGGTAFVLATNGHGSTKPPIVQKDTTTPVGTTPVSNAPTNDTSAAAPTKPKPKLPVRHDSSRVVVTPPTTDTTSSPAALIARIGSLLEKRNEANATEALALASRVLPRVTDRTQRAEVLFDRADAFVVLNKPAEACGVLTSREMRDAARGNQWEAADSNAIAEKCQ
jgi:hypothetical protein